MTLIKSITTLQSLLKELVNLSREAEWVEFKRNNQDPNEIGEYISALANSAALLGKPTAYLIWGVNDETHETIGTEFKPSATKHKKQELESWLLKKLAPKIHFRFHEFNANNGLPAVILEIQAASHTPVKFDRAEYIRVGSYKKRLAEFPEKERELWRVFDTTPFEQQFAAENTSAEDVTQLLEYPVYFSLLNKPLPENRTAILAALEVDKMIVSAGGNWHITNLGAVLFARKLQDFERLARKAIRVVVYKGNGRLESKREVEGNKGYAVGFQGLIETLVTLLPANEEIVKAFRKEVPVYPELAIRELVANAIIHQDFSLTGTGPMIELFDSRMEITNPGLPLIDTQRFLDTPPQSRNEALAAFMRRVHICEERGSGIDKVVSETERYQLPPPLFEQSQAHTRSILFAFQEYKDMESADKIRACYLHCCLKHEQREPMNNTSLRERFGFDPGNSAMASRLINKTIEAGLIRLHDETANRNAWRYIPYWA